jgi:chromosome partitioning protein
MVEIRQHFGEKVYTSTIPRSVRLAESPSFGKPIICYDIKNRGAVAYLDLAKEVMQHEEKRSRQGAERPPAAGS